MDQLKKKFMNNFRNNSCWIIAIKRFHIMCQFGKASGFILKLDRKIRDSVDKSLFLSSNVYLRGFPSDNGGIRPCLISVLTKIHGKTR